MDIIIDGWPIYIDLRESHCDLPHHVISRMVRKHILELLNDGSLKLDWDVDNGPNFKYPDDYEIELYRGVFYTENSHFCIFINNINHGGCSINVATARKNHHRFCTRKKVTKNDFHKNTKVLWKRLKLYEEDKNKKIYPETNREPDFTSKDGSQYWIYPDRVYRFSNHFNEHVSTCDWRIDDESDLSNYDFSLAVAYYRNFERLTREQVSINCSAFEFDCS